MDMGRLNLAMKMIQEDYKLNDSEIGVLSRRMLADEKEFEKVWNLYKNSRSQKGVDPFKELLLELIL